MGNVVQLPQNGIDQRIETFSLNKYRLFISGKSEKTVDAYIRCVRQFTDWIAEKPGSGGRFQPEQFTRTAVEMYLDYLEQEGYSISHRNRVKAALSSFARWLIEEKGMDRNPTRGVEIPAQALMAPRELNDDQRYALRNLVERCADTRGQAIFALGYWAGCRVSDVSHLRIEDCQLGPKVGTIRVGYKGGKMREIDLVNQVRRPLLEYLESGRRNQSSPYVFTSERSPRLSERGIHHWLKQLKENATRGEWELIKNITFHDLRHDFAHRARQSGWELEEIAFYLGHITKRGAPAIQTTARYTQVGRQQIKEKLKYLK